MPGAGQAERQDLADVDPVEGGQVRVVVLDQAAEHGLGEEQQRDHREEPCGRALGLGQHDFTGLSVGQIRRRAGVPADALAPPAIDREEDARAGEQGDQRQRRPHQDVRGGAVVDAGFGRPVVGVAVVVARPLGRRRPRAPGEECRQVPDVARLGDHVREQAVALGLRAEVGGVVAGHEIEGAHLGGREDQRLGRLVVAVGAQFGDHAIVDLRHTGGGEFVCHPVGRSAQIVGGVVGAEIPAVAVDRAVLHEPAGLEQLLTAGDVGPAEHRLTGLVDDPLRQRHRRRVGAVGQKAHHEEPEDQHQGDALHPPLAYRRLAVVMCAARG